MTDPDTTFSVVYGGVFQLKGVPDEAGNDEHFYVERDLNPNVGGTYKYFKLRWKTSAASNAMGARVVVIFTDASELHILGSATVPVYSQTYTVTIGEITFPSGEEIDKIRFYCDDYPDTVDSGTHDVYYDFLLLHAGTFTFPNTQVRADFDALRRYADIEIPGREGTVTQNLGSQSLPIILESDLEQGSWGTPKADKFYDIFHNAKTEPWQWFTCDKPKLNCKVTMRRFNPYYVGGAGGKPHCRLELREHRETDAANETYAERFGTTL